MTTTRTKEEVACSWRRDIDDGDGWDIMHPPGVQFGRLTTDHAASSNGLPVVVAEDGTALGAGEIGALTIYEPEEPYGDPLTVEQRALIAAAKSAGYVLK